MAASGVLLALALSAGAGRAQDSPPFELPRTTATPLVTFSSDRFAYDQASGTVRLQGRVRVVESTWIIRSDEMWLDLEKRRARGLGFIQMEDGASLLFGDEGEYDFAAKEGKVLGASAGFAPWRIHSRSTFIDSKRNYHFRRARFTSCNEDPDVHYYFRATGVHVFPKRWMYATNTVLFVGPVPVFYTPFWWKSLRKKHLLPTRFRPGYDRRNGPFVRSSTLFDINDSLTTRLLADYYREKGPGAGAQVQYSSATGKGSFFGYRIREDLSKEQIRQGLEPDRWAVLGDYYQSFLSSYSVQVRLQTQSDSTLNNDYFRASALRVTPELINNVALARSTSWATTRLSYSRLDREDPARRVFLKAQETVPRLDFQTSAISVPGVPVVNTLSAFADNAYVRGQSFLQKSVGMNWRSSRGFRPHKNLSYSAGLTLSETYHNFRSVTLGTGTPRTDSDAFLGRYAVDNTLRFYSRVGIWDLSHLFSQRTKPGSGAIETEASDYGTESNQVTLAEYFRPTRSVLARLGSGYDFRRFRDRAPGFRDRVQPFTADINWSPRKNLNFQAVEVYQLQEGSRFFAFQSEAGDREGRFAALGLHHSLAEKSTYYASQEFGWKPKSGDWRFGGAFRFLVKSPRSFRIEGADLFEKEFWIVKDFHDFETRFQFRERPGDVFEFNFRISLRLERDRPLRKSPESPWSLWRTDD